MLLPYPGGVKYVKGRSGVMLGFSHFAQVAPRAVFPKPQRHPKFRQKQIPLNADIFSDKLSGKPFQISPTKPSLPTKRGRVLIRPIARMTISFAL